MFHLADYPASLRKSKQSRQLWWQQVLVEVQEMTSSIGLFTQYIQAMRSRYPVILGMFSRTITWTWEKIVESNELLRWALLTIRLLRSKMKTEPQTQQTCCVYWNKRCRKASVAGYLASLKMKWAVWTPTKNFRARANLPKLKKLKKKIVLLVRRARLSVQTGRVGKNSRSRRKTTKE